MHHFFVHDASCDVTVELRLRYTRGLGESFGVWTDGNGFGSCYFFDGAFYFYGKVRSNSRLGYSGFDFNYLGIDYFVDRF